MEYSLSSTLMIVLIALVTGITDLAALIGIAFANIAMILFGWLMEVSNNGLMHGRDQSPARGERAWWTPFWFGCIAGIGPWLAIGLYLWAAIVVLEGQGPPGFVWGILISLFVLFNTFALNQWLQYRQVGALARLPLRGVAVRHPQPRREVRARLADLREHAHSLTRLSRDRDHTRQALALLDNHRPEATGAITPVREVAAGDPRGSPQGHRPTRGGET